MRAKRVVRWMIAAALLAAAVLLPAACKKEAVEAGPVGASAKPAAEMATGQKAAAPEVKTGYAPVNGLNMYYEVHGTGKPLVLVHGAFMAIPAWGNILTELAKARQVIAVELQGHGRTADIDRPFSFEAFADDIAALLRHIAVAKADIAGYSLGGGVALLTAVRHPEMIDRLVVISAPAKSEGWHKEVLETIAQIKPEVFDGTPIRLGFDRLAPDPAAFPALVDKIKAAQAKPYDWSGDIARALRSPTLIVLGDSDGIRPEHAVEMFRLVGGGVFGDVAGMPKSRLAILPGTHHVGVVFREAWLLPMIEDFLEGKAPQFPM